MGFEAVAGKGARREVARTFAALLQLVNERKVAVRSAQQGAPVGLWLCSVEAASPCRRSWRAACRRRRNDRRAACQPSCCH